MSSDQGAKQLTGWRKRSRRSGGKTWPRSRRIFLIIQEVVLDKEVPPELTVDTPIPCQLLSSLADKPQSLAVGA